MDTSEATVSRAESRHFLENQLRSVVRTSKKC